jgi:glycosyltransferase involved in cell wall biosynthesis
MQEPAFTSLYDSRQKPTACPPDVTLIIPVFNVDAYVEQCLASVFSAAGRLNIELIIIDDGAEDASAVVIKQVLEQRQPTGTLFLTKANEGISATRNLGVKLSTGRYIGFLDSDDLLTAGAIEQAWYFAEDNNCDVVLGRSQVFDSKAHYVFPFYDDWAWCRLLAGSSSRVVSTHEEPALFYLEPNSNYRLIKRELFAEGHLEFPLGLVFEDPPVHYKMLAKSSRVGLMNYPYYWYRVSRPGKITAERSLRRYHILDVSSQTLAELPAFNLTAAEGAAVLYGLIRIAWWCGTMMHPEHRPEFYEKACRIFSNEVPQGWVSAYPNQLLPDDLHYLVGSALLSGDADRLINLSYGRKQPVRSAYLLLKMGRMDLIINRLRVIVGQSSRRLSQILGV